MEGTPTATASSLANLRTGSITTAATATRIAASASASAATTIIATTTTTDTRVTPIMPKTDQQSSLTIATTTPITKRPKASCRSSPYPRPNSILLSSDRRTRKRKSLSWLPDEEIKKVHYFEHIHDERVNVHKLYAESDPSDDGSGTSLMNANSKSPNNHMVGGKFAGGSSVVDPNNRRPNDKGDSEIKCIEYSPWRSLILIDLSPTLPAPGWQSAERQTQAERETYVLGAIDLPGQTMTLDEPDEPPSPKTANGEPERPIETIPIDNPEAIYTEYPDMYATSQPVVYPKAVMDWLAHNVIM